jgi:beta-lactamase superfamily II metal-dependent hydrolase
MLDDAQNAILVNGYFSRYPAEQGQVAPDEGQIDAALKRAGITKLDVVLAAHSHFDHRAGYSGGRQDQCRCGWLRVHGEHRPVASTSPESHIHVIKDRGVLRYGDFKFTSQSPHSPNDLAPVEITEPLEPVGRTSLHTVTNPG